MAQSLALGTENVITITESDLKTGAGRRSKEFTLDVNQGDRLTFDIKGKNGVEVATAVELFATSSSQPDYITRQPAKKLNWTSPALPACRLKIRISAYSPYGLLSVWMSKENPNDIGAPAATDEISKLSKDQLLQRHQALLEELQRIASELARRK